MTYTVPRMKPDSAQTVIGLLQDRLNALNDLALTLKHVHWNVVGPNFIAVHTMLDPQVDAVRGMVDEAAKRIATLGGSPSGTPGALVAQRSWDDYSIGRAGTMEHLAALDVVYAGIIEAQREAIRPPRSWIRSRRTYSSSIPASWRSSTGSSVPTWRTPTTRSPPAAPGPRRGRLGRLARARQASVPESAEAAPVFARSAAPGGLQTGQQCGSPVRRHPGRAGRRPRLAGHPAALLRRRSRVRPGR